MATQTFNASWTDVYNATGGWSKIRGGSPFTLGGSANWHVLARIPDSVKTAINTSSTPARLDMIINMTTGATDIDIGYHRERNARSVGARGLPWYAYLETWRNGGGTGTQVYNMTSWFMPNFLSGNTQGIVLYATGASQASASSIQFRVTGTWNTAPTPPSYVRVDKTQVDVNQTLRWNASTDVEGDSLVYQIDYYNGLTWARKSSAHTGLLYNFDLSNERYSNRAKFRVRAYDGELYSAWQESPEFGVEHLPPEITYGLIEFEDINSTTLNITNDYGLMVQNASIPQVTLLDAFANDGKTIVRYILSLDGQEKTSTTGGMFTFDPIKASSDQTLRVTAEDSKGLTTTVSRTIPVIPYEPPSIQYEANRAGSIDDLTVLDVSGSFSSLGGNNNLISLRHRRRVGTGVSWSGWSNFNYSRSGTQFSANPVNLYLDNRKEWDIQIEARDLVSTRTVTLKVGRGSPIMFIDEMNDRLGVGKYPTRGSLDVDGSAYFVGDLYVNEVNISGAQRLRDYLLNTGKTATDTTSFWQNLPQGTYFITPNNIPGQPSNYGVINHTTQGEGSVSDYNTIWYTQNEGTIYRKSGNGNTNHPWRPVDEGVRGNNKNGQWIRFNDGTQICWGFYTESIPIDFPGENRGVHGTNWRRSGSRRQTFPMDFIDDYPITIGNRNSPDAKSINVIVTMFTRSASSFTFFLSTEANVTVSDGITWMAIGRWK